MKKILTLLFTSLIVFLMFVGPGNVAFAHKGDGGEDCGCPVVELTGAEKNKIVANLISSDEFKNKKMELIQSGYSWNGVSEITVVKGIPELDNFIGATVPFIEENGTLKVAIFINGNFVGLDFPPTTE